MRHSSQKNNAALAFRSNPYPPIDSLSSSHDQENYKVEHQPEKGKNYKPLVALNIDIGEDSPVKIFVYDFTDPWRRAYEFIRAYDLPEEMHEEVAILIQNAKEAKEKELRLQKLAHEKQMALQASRLNRFDSFKQNNKGDSKRQSSCELKHSNSTVMGKVRDVEEMMRNSKIESSLERNRSTDNFLKRVPQNTLEGGNRMFILEKGIEKLISQTSVHNTPATAKMSPAGTLQKVQVQQTTQFSVFGAGKSSAGKVPVLTGPIFLKDVIEKSNMLDSTALLTTSTENGKGSTTMNASPFESNICDLTDLEYSAVQPGTTPDRRSTIGHQPQAGYQILTAEVLEQNSTCLIKGQSNDYSITMENCQGLFGSQSTALGSQSNIANPKVDEILLDLFNKIDYECTGLAKSYDVYLADLSSDAKNMIHPILHSQNNDDGDFKAYDYGEFKETVLKSSEFMNFFNLN